MAEKLLIATLNIHRDIHLKYQQLQKIITTNKISILLLQETNQITTNIKHQIEATWGEEILINPGNIRSVGTAIWVSEQLAQNKTNEETIYKGRCQMVELEFGEYDLVIWNLYNHNTKGQREQILTEILPKITRHKLKTNIWGGDFNFVENKHDRKSYRMLTIQQQHTQSTKNKSPEWANIKQEHHLEDTINKTSPNTRIYTHHYKHGQARLDRIYITKNKTHTIACGKLVPIYFSDHEMYKLDLNMSWELQKPKIWKLNVSILDDKTVLHKIKHNWEL